MNNTVFVPFFKNPVFWTSLFHISSILGLILGIVLITQILRNPRKPSATIGWLLIIILVPVIGIPLYLALGDRKFNKLKQQKGALILPSVSNTNAHPINTLMIAIGLPSSTSNNYNSFHRDGRQAWQELMAMLEGAQYTIDIAIFILANDSVGRSILSLLEKKAADGVKIRLLLDGVGSLTLHKKELQQLILNGAKVAWFIPVLHLPFRGRTNLRNHRKIIIADKKHVWTGGRNLAEEYLGEKCPKDCWVDLSTTQQGSVVEVYHYIFEADWNFANNNDSEIIFKVSERSKEGNKHIQIIPSGPDVTDDPIYIAILTACYIAKHKITIITPYFIPNTDLQEAIKLAALRGVEVDLILPEKSNHYLADIARGRYVRELDKVGVNIWLIPNKMVHAKAMVFDDDFAMAGSANLDIRSLFLNCEIMSGFYSKEDIQWLSNWLELLRKESNPFQPPPANIFREMMEGIVLLAAYQL
jgi:cardiolipin synthase